MNEALAHDALFEAIDALDADGVVRALSQGATARMPRGLYTDRRDTQTPLAALWNVWPGKGSAAAETILTVLLDAGAFGTGRGVSGAPLLVEAVRQAPDSALPFIVRALCACGADVDASDPNTLNALAHASERGLPQAIVALLDAGANPDGFDRSGRTALMRALEEGQVDTARTLLSRGADPDATDADGACALLRLTRGPVEPTLVDMLLEFHADPNLKDREGRTPLLECTARGDLETMDKLLRRGAVAWHADRDGLTPLMEAARAGRIPFEAEHLEAMVTRLVQARAEPEAVDHRGHTAWQRLMSHHRPDLLDAWKDGLANGWVAHHPRVEEAPTPATRRLSAHA